MAGAEADSARAAHELRLRGSVGRADRDHASGYGKRGEGVEITAVADWLVCADVCLPAMGEAQLSVAESEGPSVADPRWVDVMAQTRRQLPQEPAGWRTRAWSTDQGYVLEVTPGAGVEMPAPYFYIDEIGVVDHAASQRVVHGGNGVRMLVSRSEFAREDPPVMRGILAADHTVDHGTSWALEFTMEGQAAGGPATEVADLLAPGVQRTGGVDPVAGSELVPVAAASFTMGLWIALLFAFLGGMALNLMPCVFPVLAVKVLGFVRHGGGNVRAARLHGLAFGAGVLGSFWLLAGVLLALRSAGESVGWGFQLQSPPVVAVLTLVLFALALNLAGVFEVGLGLTRLGGIGGGEGFRDSFLTGGLAVVVATPCTAPFMGAALGYALVQPPLVGFSVFTALGVGLALPYMVLSAVPKLTHKLPRPGPWMVTFRQVLAFPMFATSVWLVWVFGQQQGIDAVAVLFLGLTLLGFAAWLGGGLKPVLVGPRSCCPQVPLRWRSRYRSERRAPRRRAPQEIRRRSSGRPFRSLRSRSCAPQVCRFSWTSRQLGAFPAR